MKSGQAKIRCSQPLATAMHLISICSRIATEPDRSLYYLIIRSYLITGLDCGLEYWIGLMDWITRLNLFISHQSNVEISVTVTAIV